MKKPIFIIVSIAAFIACWRFIDLTPRPLGSLVVELGRAVERAEKTGAEQEVLYTISEEGVRLVVSPAYASMKKLEGGLDAAVIGRMQSEVDAIETGHLFYIKGRKVVDHALLPGSAEPILGVSAGKTVRFVVSKKETSSRPVRIEIL